ncbi:MAG: lysylphosphatidylglycerol synthase domain-containing protein [Campylobacterales bacterium]
MEFLKSGENKKKVKLKILELFQILKPIFKFLFIGGAFYLLFQNLPLSQLLSIPINWGGILLSFLLLNLSQLLSAYRLHRYLSHTPIPLPFHRQLLLYYLGLFYNLALPGGIGGDGYKLYLFRKLSQLPIKKLTLLLLLDRLAGVAGLVAIGTLLTIPFLGGWGVVIGVIGGVGGAFTLLLLHQFLKVPIGIEGFWLGVGVQLLQGLSFGTLLLSLGVPLLQLPGYLLLFYLSSLLSILPVSVGGIGIRELTLLYGSQFLGLEPVIGVAAALLFFLINLGTGAVGGIGALFWEEPPSPDKLPNFRIPEAGALPQRRDGKN